MENLGGKQVAHFERQGSERGSWSLRVHSFEWQGLGVWGAPGPCRVPKGGWTSCVVQAAGSTVPSERQHRRDGRGPECGLLPEGDRRRVAEDLGE